MERIEARRFSIVKQYQKHVYEIWWKKKHLANWYYRNKRWHIVSIIETNTMKAVKTFLDFRYFLLPIIERETKIIPMLWLCSMNFISMFLREKLIDISNSFWIIFRHRFLNTIKAGTTTKLNRRCRDKCTNIN